MEVADESMENLDSFRHLVKENCEKNDGYRLKMGVKIKERTQTKALVRIKEKMLADVFGSVEKVESMLSSKIKPQDTSNRSKLLIHVEEEKKVFEQKMNKVFDNLKKPLLFKVSDMLRGKCMFASVQKINHCCNDIKKQITQSEGRFKLVEIDNRLQDDDKGTSDLVMKILVGDVIAELQLVIDLDSAEYEFSHKLYELKRSKFFSPLTQLSVLNEQLTIDYLSEVKDILEANQNIKQLQKYAEAVTFNEAKGQFRQFEKMLKVEVNESQTNLNKINMKQMVHHLRRLKQIEGRKTKTKAFEV